jgi:hypothetical protein
MAIESPAVAGFFMLLSFSKRRTELKRFSFGLFFLAVVLCRSFIPAFELHLR